MTLLITLLCATSGPQMLHGQHVNSADEVIRKMLAHDAMREGAIGGYTGNREYLLVNRGFNRRAEMQVRVYCEHDGSKHFQVLSEDGWESANKHVLSEMLAVESASSYPDARPKSRINFENYSFEMVDRDVLLDGRDTYVVDVIPKRKDKSLFRGRIWVDAEDFALARVEGEPARNPSLWTRKVHFVQEYRKAGNYWFPVRTTSVTDAHVFGATEVSIRYFDYKPASPAPTGPELSLLEAFSD